MDWKHPLSDKLRYTKRKTTKREFNFIPIKNDLGGYAPEQEQTFALSPPKWASSPRDTPSVSGLQKKRRLVDISLIEPISGLKVTGSKPGTEQEDPTINLAAAKEKDVAKEGPAPVKALQNLPAAQSVEKRADAKSKESKADQVSTGKTKSGGSRGSGKSRSNSENDSEGSAKRSLRLSQKSNSSSKALKYPRSRSSSQSSGVEGPQNRIPKTSNVNLYKNYKEPKESGGSASEGSSSRRKRSKNQDEVEDISRRYSQKLGEAKKSSSGSVKSVDENRQPKRQRVSKRSSDLEKRSTDEEAIARKRKSIDLLCKFEVLTASSMYSVQKARRQSGGSEKSSDKSSNKHEKSTDSEKSASRGQTVEKKPTTRSSSSEKSTSRGRAVEKKPTTRSSSSEKSTSRARAVEKKSTTRSSSSEKFSSGRQAVAKKTTTIPSSSEKSTSRGRAVEKKPTTRSGSSEKSTSRGRAVEKKPTTRSSSSEKSTSRGRAVEKKPTTRSSSSEKSTSRGRAVEKKPTTRSSSSEKSTSRGRAVEKKPATRSSRSEKLVEATSVRKRQFSNFEKSAPPTSRVISRRNEKSEVSPGEGPSKQENVHAIFQAKSNQPISSTGLAKFEPLGADSSSEDDLFNPQKAKLSKKQIVSPKVAKYKKPVKSKPKMILTQSSGADLTSDEELSAETNKISQQQMSSADGVKSPSKRAMQGKVYSAKSIKEKLKRSLENLPQLSNQPQTDPTSESKQLEKPSYKDRSGEMSEEIPMQNRTVITTFAGLPLLDSDASDDHREDHQTNKLEESMVNLEEILDPNKVKLKKIYDTSWELKLKLLQPVENEGTRAKLTVTDLDVIWNFLGRSLHMILKETEDSDKRTLLKAMKSSLEEQFLSEIGKRQRGKEMSDTLKDKSKEVEFLTNKLLYLKQRNRQLAQTIYENKEEDIPQREDDILDKFHDICRSFAQFKRN